MDAAGDLACRIQSGDDLSVCAQDVALGIDLDTAHGVMRTRSHQADGQQSIVKIIGIDVVAAVLVLLNISDGTGRDGLADIRVVAAGHDSHVIIADRLDNDFRICLDAKLLEQFGKFRDRASVVAAFIISVCQLHRSGHQLFRVVELKEYALGAVHFDAVPELSQGQNIALGTFVYESVTGGRVDPASVVAAAECKVAVVDPGDRHQLREAEARGGSADFLSHHDAVALLGAAVRGLGSLGQIFFGPVNVVIQNHVDVGSITAGAQNHALVRVSRDFGSVIHHGLDAGHAAVFFDQSGRGCAGHDLVGFIGLQEGSHRSHEIGAPASAVLFCLAVAVRINIRADKFILSVPQSADQGRLGIFNKGGAHGFQPRLQILAVLDELLDQIHISVDPFALVRALAKSAVIGLEDMQIQGGEQGQLILGSSRVKLRLCPVKISLDLFLQGLKDRQIIFMYAMLGQLQSIARDEFILYIEFLIERLLAPVQDHLEFVDAALYGLDLVVGLAVISNACLSVRIRRIPYQVRHNRLILSAGYQSIAADFRVLLDHENGIAVLRCLGRRRDSCAAGADDNHVISLFDRILGYHFHSILHESVKIGAACLLRRVVDRFADRSGREGSAAQSVNAGSVGFDHGRNHDLISRSSDMGSLSALCYGYVRQRVRAEGDAEGDGAVIAVRRRGIGSFREADRRVRVACFSGCLRDQVRYGCGNSLGADGRACDAVDLGALRFQNLFLDLVRDLGSDAGSLSADVDADIRDAGFIEGRRYGNRSIHALCRSGIFTRLKGESRKRHRRQGEGQQQC